MAQKAPSDNALGILATANLAMGEVDKANQAAAALVKQVPTIGSVTLQALVEVAQGQDQQAMQSFQQAITRGKSSEGVMRGKID